MEKHLQNNIDSYIEINSKKYAVINTGESLSVSPQIDIDNKSSFISGLGLFMSVLFVFSYNKIPIYASLLFSFVIYCLIFIPLLNYFLNWHIASVIFNNRYISNQYIETNKIFSFFYFSKYKKNDNSVKPLFTSYDLIECIFLINMCCITISKLVQISIYINSIYFVLLSCLIFAVTTTKMMLMLTNFKTFSYTDV